VHTRLRRNERLAIERLQQTDVRDCQEPLLQKGSRTHAQRALNAKNGRNRSERDERVTPAELPKKKKCCTALKPLRRNEPLARERVQQGSTRGCHQPHFERLERNERAEADHCPSATEVTWHAMKPGNRKRPAPDGGPNFGRANKHSKVVKGFER
jgi:hypothetical protein